MSSGDDDEKEPDFSDVVSGSSSKAPAPPPPVPLKVRSGALGKSIGDHKLIKDAAPPFGRHDTIYVAISPEGVSPKASPKAKWPSGARAPPANGESRDTAPPAPAVT